MAGPVLQYEITADDSRLKRVMRSVNSHLRGMERQAAASARRTSAATSRAMSGAGRASGMGPLGAIAAAAKLQHAEEMRRHRTAYRNRQRETRASLTGLAQIGRVAAREEVRLHRLRERNAIREAKTRAATARSFGRGATTTVKNAGGRLLGVGGSVVGGATLLGGFVAGSAVSDQIEVEKRASKLANQAGTPEAKKTLAKEARGVKGFTGTEALGALEAFVDLTGNLDVARELLPDLGRLALATGTDLAELAATAGNAFIPLSDQIKDPTERLKQMREVMAAIAGQGQIGAVEIKDFAKEFAGLAAVSNIFGGSSEQNLKVMGALAQATRQRGGADSASEAVTAVTKFGADVTKTRGQKALKKLGINVFSDKEETQLKAPQEIIQDVLEKTGGNLTKVNKIFGERGIKTFRGFAPLYTQAERRKKGSGRKAVADEFDRLMNAQLSTEDIEKRAKSREGDADVKLVEVSKKFNEAVGTQLLPVVTDRLIPALEKLTPHIADAAESVAKFAEWLSENPWEGVGLILGGLLVKEVLAAGISSLLTGAFTKVAGAVLAAHTATKGAAAASALSTGMGALGGTAGTAGAAATGGILSRAGGALTGALGVAGGTLAAGGAMVAGLGAAGYNAYKLYTETDGFSDFGGDVAKAVSGKDYDEMMRKAGISTGSDMNADATAKNTEAATKNVTAADKMDAAATKMAEAAGALAANTNPRRTNPINLR